MKPNANVLNDPDTRYSQIEYTRRSEIDDTHMSELHENGDEYSAEEYHG